MGIGVCGKVWGSGFVARCSAKHKPQLVSLGVLNARLVTKAGQRSCFKPALTLGALALFWGLSN